MVAKQTKLNHT